MNRPRALERNDQGRFGTDARPVYANNHDMRNAHHSSVAGWKSQSEYNGPGDFVFPSRRHKGKKPLDLAAVLKKKIQPAFAKVGIIGVDWHTFRHDSGPGIVGTRTRLCCEVSGQSPM
jgi:hypothetical protein